MERDFRRFIHQLSGSEAKTILLRMMIRLKMLEESDEPQEKMVDHITFMYDQFIAQRKFQAEREYKSIHLVSGDSSAGSLRVGLGHENKIIGFPDFFAVGPINNLHQKDGFNRRYEWLREHINFEEDYIEEEYERRFTNTLEAIATIPSHIPIVIWTGENTDEQIGMRYLLYVIKEKTNDVYIINTTLAYQEIFNSSETQNNCIHTGEIEPEKLNKIYQKKLTKPLTVEERTQFEEEWAALSESSGIVRIWENQSIVTVNEDYFDPLIISTAEKLHAKQKEIDFIKAGRLIGGLLGLIENNVGDGFLEYRVRKLVYQGIFDIKGIPKAMRYYSIKLNQSAVKKWIDIGSIK